MQSYGGSTPEFSASGHHDDRDLRFGPAPSGSTHSAPVNPGKAGRLVRVRGFTWLILGIATIALLSTVGQILGFYTDWLWFHEVQFTSVFATVLQTQVLLGVVTGAAFFLILTLPVSVTLALFAGWLGTDRWELVLKALNPTSFGIRDPLFDQDVAFYVFRLPPMSFDRGRP